MVDHENLAADLARQPCVAGRQHAKRRHLVEASLHDRQHLDGSPRAPTQRHHLGRVDAGPDEALDILLDNGQSLKIEVPSNAPIVEFEKADKSIVTKGSHIFTVTAKDGSTLTSKLVGIGKDGLTPPM